MSTAKIEDARRRLTQSAFDFLVRATREIEASTKYSVIHFATAVELLLKARLMNEHWTLVVERSSDADLNKFLSGACRTVSSIEAVQRLEKICHQHIPKNAVTQFKRLSDHRNQIIHFFHDATDGQATPGHLEKIVAEQFRCWFHLERLLSNWSDQFRDYTTNISHVGRLMQRNRTFLDIAFKELKPEIDKAKRGGAIFCTCSGCGHEASELKDISTELFKQTCWVCKLPETFLKIECPHCQKLVRLEGDYAESRPCPHCENDITASDLHDILDHGDSDPTYGTSINCALCTTHDSVVLHENTHICTYCLGIEDSVSGCEWCNEAQMGGGDLEASFYYGCEFCEGRAGWKDD